MSLLEDVFLRDEADEANELERIIEGDEYDDRPRPVTPDSDDNSEKEDEAEEDKRHVDPASAKPKRVVKNPRVILNPARLTGPRGIQIIPKHFQDFKFKGKGHEKEDLDLVLKKLEHWAYRLYPKFEFDDCLKKIESLGNKRPVMVHLTKIRTDQFMSDDTVVQKDSSDDEAAGTNAPAPEEDEFDKLLQQQIDLARSTPAPGSVKKPGFSTPAVDRFAPMPKATSSPSLNDEQRQRMLRNRQLAEEKRLARLRQNNSSNTITNENTTNELKENNESKENNVIEIDLVQDITDDNTYKNVSKGKSSRLNVIDSSDEDDGLVINESITVDIHSCRNREKISDINNEKDNDAFENMKVVVNNEIESRISENIIETQAIVSENDSNTNMEHISKENNEEITLSNKNTDNVELSDVIDKSIEITESTDLKKIDNQNVTNLMQDEEVQGNNDTNLLNNEDNKVIRKGNLDNEINEDMMDVDFSDDF